MAKGTGYAQGYPTSEGNPWISALKGLGVGALQSVINYANDPYTGGGAAKILGSAVNSFSRTRQANKQLAEMARQEDRTNENAINQYALQSNMDPNLIRQMLNGHQLTGYESTVGGDMKQGRGNVYAAQQYGVQNPQGAYGLDPTLANSVFKNVQQGLQNEAGQPVAENGIQAGVSQAGNVAPNAPPVPNTIDLIPGSRAALGMQAIPGYGPPQAPQAPAPPQAAPQPQRIDPQQVPVAPSQLQQPIDPEMPAYGGVPTLQAGAANQAPPEPPPGRSLAQIAGIADPKLYLEGYQQGGAVQGKRNDQNVTLYDAAQTANTQRQKQALDAPTNQAKAEAYQQQVQQSKNLVELLQSGTPQEKAIAKQAILKPPGGAGSEVAANNAAIKNLDSLSKINEVAYGGKEGLITKGQSLVDRGVIKESEYLKKMALNYPNDERFQSKYNSPTPGAKTPPATRMRQIGLTTRPVGRKAFSWKGI